MLVDGFHPVGVRVLRPCVLNDEAEDVGVRFGDWFDLEGGSFIRLQRHFSSVPADGRLWVGLHLAAEDDGRALLPQRRLLRERRCAHGYSLTLQLWSYVKQFIICLLIKCNTIKRHSTQCNKIQYNAMQYDKKYYTI